MTRELSKAGAKLECDVANRVLEPGCTYSLRIFHENDHFINNVLENMPLGRIRSLKVWTAIGKECVHSQLIKYINDAIF